MAWHCHGGDTSRAAATVAALTVLVILAAAPSEAGNSYFLGVINTGPISPPNPLPPGGGVNISVPFGAFLCNDINYDLTVCATDSTKRQNQTFTGLQCNVSLFIPWQANGFEEDTILPSPHLQFCGGHVLCHRQISCTSNQMRLLGVLCPQITALPNILLTSPPTIGGPWWFNLTDNGSFLYQVDAGNTTGYLAPGCIVVSIVVICMCGTCRIFACF